MNCLLCGHELPEEALICPFCGARIADEEEDSIGQDFFDKQVSGTFDSEERPADEQPGTLPHNTLQRVPRVILTRKRTGETFEISEFPAVIGRSSKSDVIIPDNSLISRMHLRFFQYIDGSIYVEDLKTTNHSSLNGVQLSKPVELPYSASLILADEVFTVQVLDAF